MALPLSSLPVAVTAAIALVEHNRCMLLRGECWLSLDFHLEVEEESKADAKKLVVQGPFPKDEVQSQITGTIPPITYTLSRLVGDCAPMGWIAVYARESISNLAYKRIWNPELAQPINMHTPPVVPRARGSGALNTKLPCSIPVGGPCARKVGQSAIAIAFAKDIADRKIDMFEVAAQSSVMLEAGRTYTYADLFGHARFPVVACDNCCLAHYEQAQRRCRERVLNKSRPQKPCFLRMTRARAVILREAARKAAARKVLAMESLHARASDSDEENPP